MLVAAVLVLLLSMGQVVYRLTLPTDGWGVLTGEIEGSNWIFYENLVGADSDLQRWDAVLAVDGRSVSGSAANEYVPAPDNWQIGRTVTMLILRDGAEMELAVPVVAWTGTAVWRYHTATPGQVGNLLGAILLLIICWFTFLRRPDIPSARALSCLALPRVQPPSAALCRMVYPYSSISLPFIGRCFLAISFLVCC